jgi:hypothetical protein
MAVRPRVPLPGKVIAVVEDKVLKKVVLISVEEHVANCAAFLGFVAPDPAPTLTDALLFHDVGKKLFRTRGIYRNARNAALRKWGYDASLDGREDVVELLKRDYAATMSPGLVEPLSEEVVVSEVADAYLDFVGLGGDKREKAAEGGVKAYPIRVRPEDQKSPVVAASYRLDRPFGNHAAPIKAEHLPEGLRDRERLAGLIRLHHGFQVSKIIPEAAVWESFPETLYALMTLDHLGSSWAERLVLLEEGGEKRHFAGGVDFGEIESWMEGSPKAGTNPDGTKTASAEVHLRHRSGDDIVLFSVTYFAREVNYVDPSLRD